MARILQIRRGTAAQNNNFTGMSGEITMDTDTKTLRVHDGETLGGFALARADDVVKSEFDITSVSDDFWDELFAKHATTAPTMLTSSEMELTNTTGQEYIFSRARTPIFVSAALVCKTAECGYSADDIVASYGIGTRANPTPLAFSDDGGLHVRQMVGGDPIWVSHRDTGVTTNITIQNWRVIFRVYC